MQATVERRGSAGLKRTQTVSSGHWSGWQSKTMHAPLGWVMSQNLSPLTEQFAADEQPSPMRGEHATDSALMAMARKTMALMAARTLGELPAKRHVLSPTLRAPRYDVGMWKRMMLVLAMTSSGCVINRGSLSGPAVDDDAAIPRLPDANLDAYSLFDVPPDAVVLPDVNVDAGMMTPPDAPLDAIALMSDAWAPDAWAPDAFVCTAGELRCNANLVERCDANAWVTASTCGVLGCSSAGTPHCRVMVPSTVAASEMNGVVDVDLAGGMVYAIDTGACSTPVAGVTPRVSGSHCVYAVRSLRVRPTAILAGVGSRPLIVLATGDITVEAGGSILAAAYTYRAGEGVPAATSRGRFLTAGPGATDMVSMGAGGLGASSGSRDGGGGGGGFCTNGAAGGRGEQDGETAASGGAAGAVSVPSTIGDRVLRGGASGGSANDGLGGGGGGAVQLSARGRLTVAGSVVATGGAGEGGNSGRAGGGGGSGGMILVEATELVIGPSTLLVRGGGGGGGGCFVSGGGGERAANGTHGDNGVTGGTGGAGGTCGGMFAGGNGGSAAAPAAGAGAPNVNGGGGGGGAGCVSIRRIDAATFDTAIVPNLPGVAALGSLLAE